MMRAQAWLLDFGAGVQAAVGERELLHLIDASVTYEVPLTPAYCQQIVVWQEKLLPVLDVAGRVGADVMHGRYMAVVGYKAKKDAPPQFGALYLAAPPKHVIVTDEQACDLPESMRGWRDAACSCFELEGVSIPVLDLNRLFNSAPEAV